MVKCEIIKVCDLSDEEIDCTPWSVHLALFIGLLLLLGGLPTALGLALAAYL